MTCDREMLLLISSYADGEATPEEAERAAEHLVGCTGCRKMVEQWQGHQQLFTWAYTREITDGCTADELIRLERKDHPMTEDNLPRKAKQERKTNIAMPRRWAWAATLAAVLLIALTAYAVVAHSWLKVGQQLVTTIQPRETRMAINIGLTVGPHAKIRRTGTRTLRIEQGWVAADVRNGSSVIIETPRLRATDRGTKFHVGAGAKADYVTVEKGAVEVKIGAARRMVKAGQALFAAADGTYRELVAPIVKPDKGKEAPLRANLTDVPTTIEAIQWEEGVARLVTRFPNLHVDGGRGTSYSRDNKVDYIIGFEDIATADYRQALRVHLPQLAHILAGGTGDTGNWEIPVGVLQLAGITSPTGLADDVYYLHLAPAKGNILVWRFSGSRGTDVDVPVTFKAGHYWISNGGLLERSGGETIEHPGQISEYIGKYLLADWPDAQKPYLEFRVNGPQELALWQEERVMVAEVARQCAGVPDLSLRYPNDQYYYLDADRKHRLMIAWNQDAGRQLAQVSDLTKNGRGGTVTLAVINTELPLADPPAPAGIYLLRLVLPAGGKSPSLELGTPGNQRVPAWGGSSRILLAGKPDDNGGGHSFGNGLTMPQRYGRVEIECRLGSVYNGAFPFTFKVFDRSKGAWPGKMWTEGWIRIKKL